MFTPAAGDILLDAWLEVDTNWDGTTPSFDIGNFDTSAKYGFFNGLLGAPLSMAPGADAPILAGFISGQQLRSLSQASAVSSSNGILAAFGLASPYLLQVENGPGAISGILPAKCTGVPIQIVVTQNGLADGADPGSTQGAAILYLVTATPA